MSSSSNSNSLIEIKSADALKECLADAADDDNNNNNKCKAAVLLFGADWHEACPMLKMVLGALAQQQQQSNSKDAVLFGSIDAEAVSDLSDQYEVTMVPTLILLLNNSNSNSNKVYERLEGEILSDPSHVTLAVQRLFRAHEAQSMDGGTGTGGTASSSLSTSTTDGGGDETNNNNNNNNTINNNTTTTTTQQQQLNNDRLERLIRGDTVMLFMKGNPQNPRCGFSRQAVELLNEQEVSFGSFDILSDDVVRQGLKVYSDWPTYPQIYVKGELMGGLDIMKETAADGSGSLKEEWDISDDMAAATTATELSLNDRLAKLVKRHTVMLFMKGLPSNPQCGFSRQIVGILDETGVPYDAFNIFEDEDVRQGLKEFSDWPTYPQLYVEGELLGGLDIVQELKESGELEDMLK